MASRTIAPTPQRPVHTVEQKRRDVVLLERRISELEAFDPQTVTKRYSDPNVMALQTAIDDTLAEIFGNGTDENRRYSDNNRLTGPHVVSMSSSSFTAARRGGVGGQIDESIQARQSFADGKERALSLLRQAVRKIQEEIELAPASLPAVPTIQARPKPSRKIFIVHGRDEGLREAVARFLFQIGFEPVILHEQANQGQTVIEKVETHSDVGFAVILLTPDDEGACAAGLQNRARGKTCSLSWDFL